jgi:hypothetical protein
MARPPRPLVDTHDGSPLPDWAPIALRHTVTADELFCDDAIAELAGSRGAGRVITITDAPSRSTVAPGPAGSTRGDGAEFARAIDEDRSWMLILDAHFDARYADLVHRCLAHLAPPVIEREGGLQHEYGTVFAATAGVVVPAHIDRNHNLVLQIQGTKTISIGTGGVTPAEIERAIGPGRPSCDRLPPEYETFELGPGTGVYIPPLAPHWVVGDEGRSVALSCAFRTAKSDRIEVVHHINRRLRTLGVRHPRPPGERAAIDGLKVVLGRAVGTVRAVASRR